MDAKQFLQLNESMIAIQVLMSGKLADETAAAKAALDALDNAQTLGERQDKLVQDQADFEAYKANVEAQIQADKDKVNALQYQLSQDQQTYQSDVDDLAAKTAALAAEKSQFESDKAAHDQVIANAQAALVDAQDKVIAQSNDLSAAQRAVDAREAAVADKLAKLSALV